MTAFGNRVNDHHNCIFSVDSGSSTMKSTLIVSQGASGIGRGCNSLNGGWQIDLVQRHMSQVETYLPGHMWPPVIPWNEFQSLPSARMPCKFGVMTEGRDFATKVRSRDIDLVSVVQQTVLHWPLRGFHRFSWRFLELLNCLHHYLFLILVFHPSLDFPKMLFSSPAPLLKPILRTILGWVVSSAGYPLHPTHGQISDSACWTFAHGFSRSVM